MSENLSKLEKVLEEAQRIQQIAEQASNDLREAIEELIFESARDANGHPIRKGSHVIVNDPTTSVHSGVVYGIRKVRGKDYVTVCSYPGEYGASSVGRVETSKVVLQKPVLDLNNTLDNNFSK